MTKRGWCARLFGAELSSEKNISDFISSLKPNESKMVIISGEIIIVSLSSDGKVSIISKNNKKSEKEVIELW